MTSQQTETAGEADSAGSSHSFLDYLTFVAAGIAGSWGLMEILLVTDPFLAAYFKYFWLLGIGIFALFIGVFIGTNRRLAYVGIGLALAVAIYCLSEASGPGSSRADIFSMGVLGDWLEDSPLSRGDPAFYWLMAGVFATGVFLFTTAARCLRRWLTANVKQPLIVAGFAIGGFALILSMGRASEIDRNDVALEELRKSGMLFDVDALQNALFFLNDRGLELYRQAGFQPDDVLLALGRPSKLSPNEQLLFSIVERSEESVAGSRTSGGRSERPRRFADMMRKGLSASEEQIDSQTFARPFARYTYDGERCDAPDMPFMSYVVERGALEVAAAFWRPDERQYGRQLVPLLYDADIGAASPAAAAEGLDGGEASGDRAAAPTACRPPAIRRLGAEDASEPLYGEQAHLHAVIGPLFGLATARGARGEPIGAADEAAVCDIWRGMRARDVRPSALLDPDRDRGLLDLIARCEARFPEVANADADAVDGAADATLDAVYGEARRSGYTVRSLDDGGCEVSPFALTLLRETPQRYAYGLDATEAGSRSPIARIAQSIASLFSSDAPARRAETKAPSQIWFSEFTGEVGAEATPIIGALQYVDGQVRLIQGERNALRATGWSRDLEPIIASGGGQLVVLRASGGGVMNIESLVDKDAKVREISLRRPSVDDDEEAATVSETAEGALVVGAGRRLASLEAENDLGVEASISNAPGDICLEFRRKDDDASEVLASRFIARGESGKARLRAMRPGDKVEVLAWLASNVERARASVTLVAVEPKSNLAPTRDDALARPMVGWLEGVRIPGQVSADESESFVAVTASEMADVVLTLDGLESDVDIEVLHAAEEGGEFLSVASSIEGGSTPERINGLFPPGAYLIRVYSADDTSSPFTLNFESVENSPDIGDANPPNSLLTAYGLGEVGPGLAPLEVADAILAEGDTVTDWYAITVVEEGLVTATLDELNADIDLAIVSETDTELASSVNGASEAERISLSLAPGRYFLKVYAAIASGASRYRLAVGASTLQRTDLGALAPGESRREAGRLAAAAPVAEYLFSVAEPGQVEVRLSELAFDADVTLEDASGNQIGESANGASEAELITQYLAPGDYRIIIKLYVEDSTDYALDVVRR